MIHINCLELDTSSKLVGVTVKASDPHYQVVGEYYSFILFQMDYYTGRYERRPQSLRGQARLLAKLVRRCRYWA